MNTFDNFENFEETSQKKVKKSKARRESLKLVQKPDLSWSHAR